MSSKERERLLVLSRVRDQGLSLKRAAEVLSLSYRQTRRIYRRFAAEGDVGLLHKSRGKPSGRGLDPKIRQTVLKLYKDKYDDFGPTLAAEKLLSEEGIALDHETLRRWLIRDGSWKRRRKRSTYRKWRTPRSRFGELVQMDGSHHRWFEDRGEETCLMNMVDDATKTTLSLMDKKETTELAMRLLWAWIDKHGIPEALYVDRKSVFVTDREPTIKEQLRGELPVTHFGRACRKLGIKIICANSPQAKGRVERSHGVYQDRLVKEFRLKGVGTIEGANEILASGFIESLNAKFAKAPADPCDHHRSVDTAIDLAAVFSFEYERTIGNDFTVRFKGRLFQITRQHSLPPAGSKLMVQERLDGTTRLVYRDRELAFSEITKRPRSEQVVIREPRSQKTTAQTPGAEHPWRRGYERRQLLGAAHYKRTFLKS